MIAIVPHAITDTGLGVSIRLAIRVSPSSTDTATRCRSVTCAVARMTAGPAARCRFGRAIGARLHAPVLSPRRHGAQCVHRACHRPRGPDHWQEDTDHPSYYESYDLARRAFARLHRFERENRRRVMTPSRRTKKDGQ